MFCIVWYGRLKLITSDISRLPSSREETFNMWINQTFIFTKIKLKSFIKATLLNITECFKPAD